MQQKNENPYFSGNKLHKCVDLCNLSEYNKVRGEIMKGKMILHCDINHCYAQIEEMKFPDLRNVPMAVGGDSKKRHGIILAKNDLAKKYKIKTGETIFEALQKCPELLIIPPHYEEYIYYTEKVKEIYYRYSDKVESFGLDEAWIDVTNSFLLFKNGREIAEEIQRKVFEEIGLTISIGISFNKIFAKFGSDLIKPNGIVEITPENFKEKVWPCPVEDLIYVGKATKRKLNFLLIETVGDLAKCEVQVLKKELGKMGEIIWQFANGKDEAEVITTDFKDRIKSVGNSTTMPKDVTNKQEAKIVLNVLCESVAARLKEKHLQGRVISLSVRNQDMFSFIRQKKLSFSTNLVSEILDVSMQLLVENVTFENPIRSFGVSVSGLESEFEFIQFDLFQSQEKRWKQKKMDLTIDQIRDKYGYYKIKKCNMLLDETLSGFNPKKENVIHPIGYF